jgi:2-keto-4-pentenoate hydratase
MDGTRTKEAATILWDCWRQGRRIDGLPPTCRPQTVEDGYAVQAALAALTGDDVIGWKIAATSAEGQRHIGVDGPLAGRLFARFLRQETDAIAATPLLMRVAEAEFAFRFARAMPPREGDYATAEVLDAVGALHLAIEVPDSRYNDFATAGAAQLVADDACAAFFVLGREVKDWRGLDLVAQKGALLRDGDLVSSGSGALVLGDPRLALTWFVNDRSRRGVTVRRGDIVTTGTCAKPAAVAPGARIEARFEGLGAVTIRFD